LSSIRSRLGGPKSIKPSVKRAAALAAVAAAAAVPAFLAPAAASASTNFYGSGSSAAQAYVQALFAGYHKIHPGIVFHYNPDGGNAGVTDVVNGNSQFAIQTAAPSATKKPTEWGKLFLDALCIDVNAQNKLTNVTESAVQGIFQSNPLYNSWSQVPAASGASSGLGSQTVLAEGRNSAAGQYTFFVQEILKGGSENQSVTQESTDGEVKVQIQTHKNAIGYVGLANSAGKNEKALELNGVPCAAKYVASEKYPLWRWDWVVLPASPSPQLVAFFDWVTNSPAAAKIINEAGAVARRHSLQL
jgi:ABC-type phosphate transport system substrate-binding protein